MAAGGRERCLAEMAALGLDADEADVRTFPAGTRTATDAAAAIGCEVRAIVKSLVFMTAEDTPVLALVNGAARADTGRLAAAAGTEAVRQATPEEVRRHTGYAIGGTPPVARVGEIPRWCDRTLLDLDEVWASAGTPTDVFRIAPARLVALTGAVVADLVGR
jgi:prolyl-tRNA editing enzyme YbaK/EbsC (Cys-tRNA(Pro) deacylase)